MPTGAQLLNYALPIASSVVGGVLGTNAVNNATGALTQGGTQAINTITAGQKQAQGTLNSTVQQQQDLLNPFVTAGTQDLAALQSGLQPGGGLVDPFNGNTQFNFNPADVANDPAYQFRLQQGLKALNAQGAASGNRFSGATMKSLADYAAGTSAQYENQDFNQQFQTFNQNYARAEEQFRQNEATKLAALQQGTAAGQGAAGTESNALGQYGTNTVNLTTGTSKAVADLQTQIASAKAAGDVATANQLQGILNGITSGVGQAQTLNSLNPANQVAPYGTTANPNPANLPDAGNFAPGNPALETNIAPTGAAGATAATGGAATAAGTTGAALAPGASSVGPLAGIPGAGGALAAPAIAAPALAASAGAGEAGAAGAAELAAVAPDLGTAAEAGTSSAIAASGGGTSALAGVGSLLTNPITIGVGAAIAGALIWKGTQTHPVADTFVKEYQKPFGDHLGSIVNSFDSALASGQMTKAQAQTARDQTANLITQFETDGANFAKQGDKQMSVWNQAQRTMAEDFGGTVDPKGHNNQPDWSKVLGKMDQEISALPG